MRFMCWSRRRGYLRRLLIPRVCSNRAGRRTGNILRWWMRRGAICFFTMYKRRNGIRKPREDCWDHYIGQKTDRQFIFRTYWMSRNPSFEATWPARRSGYIDLEKFFGAARRTLLSTEWTEPVLFT